MKNIPQQDFISSDMKSVPKVQKSISIPLIHVFVSMLLKIGVGEVIKTMRSICLRKSKVFSAASRNSWSDSTGNSIQNHSFLTPRLYAKFSPYLSRFLVR